MCSSIGCCLLTRRNHINIKVCPRSDCCRGKLLKNSPSCSSDTLSVSSRKSCANLIVILAIVTAAATRLAFPFHTTWSITSEGLRRSGIFFSLPALSGIALPVKLPSSISRNASERSQCVSRCQYAPKRTECSSFDCSLECGAGESNRRRGEWTLPSLNLGVLVCRHRSVILAVVRPNT